MNKEEKIYIIWQCIKNLETALVYKVIEPYKCLMSLSKGIVLKEIIEEFIDCQSEPYYSLYQKIVKLANQLDI